MKQCRGQIVVEYSVMFIIIVAVIIYASMTFIRPAANRYFNTVHTRLEEEISDRS